jgi:hypothetical protein
LFSSSLNGPYRKKETHWRPNYSQVVYIEIRVVFLTQKVGPVMSMLGQEVTLVACIREVYVWKFGQDIEDPEAFLGFPQSLQGDDGIVSYLGHDSFLRHYFQFIIHQSIFNLMIYVNIANFVK